MQKLNFRSVFVVAMLVLLSSCGSGDSSTDESSNGSDDGSGTDSSTVPPTVLPTIIAGLPPKIFWVSQPVQPNETVVATGGNITDNATVDVTRVEDTNPGSPLATATDPSNWTTITPLQTSLTSIKFVVPSTWTHGVYAFKVKSTTLGDSDIKRVNAPDIWWVQGDLGDTGSPGGWLRVQGTNIAIPESSTGLKPRLALVQNGVVVTTLIASDVLSGYSAKFAIPSTLPAGAYDVHVHNGHGGPNGWTKYDTFDSAPITGITIADPAVWPTMVFDVTTMTGDSDGARVDAAIAAAKINGGGVVYFPAGTYTLDRAFYDVGRPLLGKAPHKILFKGAGRDQTFLKWPTFSSSNLPPNVFALVSGYNYSMEDLSLESGSSDYGAHAVGIITNTEPVHFRRLRITMKSQTYGPLAFWGFYSKNVELTDNDVIGSWHFATVVKEGYWYIARNTVKVLGVVLGVSSASGNIAEYNTFTTPAVNANNDTAGSVGITNYGEPYSKNFYFGHNTQAVEAAAKSTDGGRTGIGADGTDTYYYGQVLSSSGTALALSPKNWKAPKVVKPGTGFAGAMVAIIGGTGQGQYRLLSNFDATQNVVMVNKPWDIPPDATSWVQITNMAGRVLIIDNTADQAHDILAFYLSADVVVANNRFTMLRGTPLGEYGAILNGLAGSISPNWHYQMLGNNLTGAYAIQALIEQGGPLISFNRPLLSGTIYRRNIIVSDDYNLSTIGFGGGAGTIKDVLMEHNQIPQFQVYSGPFVTTDTVVRENFWPGAKVVFLHPVPSGGSLLVIPVADEAAQDATFSELTPSIGALSPVPHSFIPRSLNFSMSVANGVAQMTFKVQSAQTGATIQARINGGSFATVVSGSSTSALPLQVGLNTVEVKITSPNGRTSNTYTVKVTRG